MKRRINPSFVAIVLLLSSGIVAAANDVDSSDGDAASTSHLRWKLPQQLLQQQQPSQSSSKISAPLNHEDNNTNNRQLRPKIAKRAKKKKKKKGKAKKKGGTKNKGGGGGGGGGGSCTPQEQDQCCSKYKKADFNMACKRMGCKTNKCKRFNFEAISLVDDDDYDDDDDYNWSVVDDEAWIDNDDGNGDGEGSSLAQQYLNGLQPRTSSVSVATIIDESSSYSSCESESCIMTATYNSQKSYTYQDGDIVQSDCIVYRCREYPYSLWCTNEGYVPGTDKGIIAWEMIGPC